jgi:hypothetical protein
MPVMRVERLSQGSRVGDLLDRLIGCLKLFARRIPALRSRRHPRLRR